MGLTKKARESLTNVREEPNDDDVYFKNLQKLRKPHLLMYAKTVNVEPEKDMFMPAIRDLILEDYKRTDERDKPKMEQYLDDEISDQDKKIKKKKKGKGKGKERKISETSLEEIIQEPLADFKNKLIEKLQAAFTEK
jgi:hypothetical protein